MRCTSATTRRTPTRPIPTRGPAGHGKWTAITEPGNYGWPYCATAELPYVDYDFATGESGAPFDCARPINSSPNNTGRIRLPAVVQPHIWYSYGVSPQFPELGEGGIGPMAGPAYDFDPSDRRGPQPVGWPRYYDGMPLLYEWTRDYIKGIRLEPDGELASIEDVIPSIVTDNPMDMEFGPDGALYVLEYGDGYFAENPDAQLSRIDFIGAGGNRSPVPAVSATPTNGPTPLTVSFTSDGTVDPDGDRIRYSWDFDGDGDVDSTCSGPDAYLPRQRGLPGDAHRDRRRWPTPRAARVGRRRHRRGQPGADRRAGGAGRRPAVPVR